MANITISFFQVYLPKVRYRGTSREQWGALAACALHEAAGFLSAQFDGAPWLHALGAAHLELSFDIRTARLLVNIAPGNNPAVRDMVDLYLSLDREAFKIAWQAAARRWQQRVTNLPG